MKSKTIKLDSITIEIEKLPLIRYAELLQALKILTPHLTMKDGASMIDVLMQIASTSLPDLIKVLMVVTPLKQSDIEKLGLDEIVRIVMAISEVNGYDEVWTHAKKVIALAPQK